MTALRKRGRRLLAVAVALAAALTAVPAAATGTQHDAATVTETLRVSTRHGDVRVDVVRPDGDGPFPLLFTWSPLSADRRATTGTSAAADDLAAEYVPLGVARAVADAWGSGGSDGCWDWGGRQEQEALDDTVTALAQMQWADGRVAAYGAGVDGAGVSALLAMRHPAVTTAISVGGVTSWYDHAFAQGTRYTGFGQDSATSPESLALARTRVPAEDGSASERLTCDPRAHLDRAGDESPDYDDFWQQRDYVALAADGGSPITASALLAHGYDDQAVKADQSIDMFNALPTDDPDTAVRDGVEYKRLVLGPWDQGAPTFDGWSSIQRRWLQQFLIGEPGGLRNEPMVQTMSTTGHDGHGGHGAWAYGDAYPLPQAASLDLYLRRSPIDGGGLSTQPPGNEPPATYVSTGKDVEEHSRHHPALHEIEWLWYVSKPLESDTRLSGDLAFDVWFSPDDPDGQIDVILVEFHPHDLVDPDMPVDGHPAISRGFLNIQYRDGLDTAVPAEPLELYRSTVELQRADHVVPAGAQIGLLVQGSNVTWVEPHRSGQRISIVNDGSRSRESVLRLQTFPSDQPHEH